MILSLLKNLVQELKQTHPKAKFYLTGGIVREMIWRSYNEKNKENDYDVEVFGILPSEFYSFISSKLKSEQIWSKTADIFQSEENGYKIQWSFPRRERNTGPSHQDFDVQVDIDMTTKEAQSRRDYTMDAVYLDVETNEFIDHFGGVQDALGRELKVISDTSFKDDPLRLLRGARLAAEHRLFMNQETITLGTLYARAVFLRVSKERLWNEFYRMFAGDFLYNGMSIIKQTNMIDNIPPLSYTINRRIMVDGEQSYLWDTILNNVNAIDRELMVHSSEYTKHEKAIIKCAALFMDTGQLYIEPYVRNGYSYFPGHEVHSSIAFEQDFVITIGVPNQFTKTVVTLINEHEFLWYNKSIAPPSAKHLLFRLKNIEYKMLKPLLNVSRSYSGVSNWWLTILSRYVSSVDITPIINGDDLIQLGVKPGPDFGTLLRDIYMDQLNGYFSNKPEGIARLRIFYSVRQ